MRRIVDSGLYSVTGYSEAHGMLRHGGVFDPGKGWPSVTPVDILKIADFSDAVLAIRNQKDMQPQRTQPELVAHVICNEAVERPPLPGASTERPNDVYFAVTRGLTYTKGKVIAFAALHGDATVPPHSLVVQELGISSAVPSPERAFPGLIALTLGGVVAHADERGWLAQTPSTAQLTVRSPSPSEVGIQAMQVLGYEHDAKAGEFRASIDTVRQAFAELAISEA